MRSTNRVNLHCPYCTFHIDPFIVSAKRLVAGTTKPSRQLGCCACDTFGATQSWLIFTGTTSNKASIRSLSEVI